VIICVPVRDPKPWPTLGPYVCDFIERHLVYGPGDLVGEPVKLDREKRGLIYSAYEVHPKGTVRAGRRRYKRIAWSLRKGLAKTECAAFLAAAELSPIGPVRTVGWDKKGYPVGGPVVDPYIPMVAYTEEQTEELAYGALKVILRESPIAKDFDIGEERIMRHDGHGKAEALASSPNANDGARTTFQHFDETHRWYLPALKKAHHTMLQNIPKRKRADAWSLETTTAFMPGENSVAEETMAYAQQIIDEKVKDKAFFFFHRQASDHHDLTTEKGQRAAVLEASGDDGVAYGDIDEIVRQFKESTDKSYIERVWTNRLVRGHDKAFDVAIWKSRARADYAAPKGAWITLGFDGSRFLDATALVATEILTGFQWPLGIWERPTPAPAGWEVPKDQVDAAVDAAYREYRVWRMYADPPYWEETVATWAGRHGKESVIEWFTSRTAPMAYAVRSYTNAMRDGSVSHDGNAVMARHIGNAHRRQTGVRDEKGEPLHTIQKERKDSPLKIDTAMAGCLSWEARSDALIEGIGKETPSVYEERGLLVV
jgi:phage terminase large subunit-like protein